MKLVSKHDPRQTWRILKTATLLEALRTSRLIQNHTVPCRSLTLRTSKIHDHKSLVHEKHLQIYIYICIYMDPHWNNTHDLVKCNLAAINPCVQKSLLQNHVSTKKHTPTKWYTWKKIIGIYHSYKIHYLEIRVGIFRLCWGHVVLHKSFCSEVFPRSLSEQGVFTQHFIVPCWGLWFIMQTKLKDQFAATQESIRKLQNAPSHLFSELLSVSHCLWLAFRYSIAIKYPRWN